MISWDITLLQRINREWAAPFLDWLMPAVSAIGAWAPVIVVAVVLVAIRSGRRGRVMLLCAGLAVGIADGVVCKSLKSAVGRVRPRDAMSGVIVRDLAEARPDFLRLFKSPKITVSKPPEDRNARGKSFPSSHVANMFALATVIALFQRGWGVFFFIIAALVAWSRVYVGAHWPSDVPPSMGIGILIAWVVVMAARRWIKAAR